MKNRSISLLFVLVLAALSLACSFGAPKVSRLDLGSTQTFTLSVPLPGENAVQDVDLVMTVGRFKLTGGANALLEGNIRYNVAEWKPVVQSRDHGLTVTQGDPNRFTLGTTTDGVVNDWDLKLGSVPMNLTLTAAAFDSDLNLSGLPLQSLVVKDGASDSKVHFNSFNPGEMQTLVYQTGASNVEFTGLGNANFSQMTFDGGAGQYTFDFSGKLQRNADITIKTGLSDIQILVPTGVPARVELDRALADVKLDGSWRKADNAYQNDGSGNGLTIKIEMGAGSLHLANR